MGTLSNYWTGDFLGDTLLFLGKAALFIVALGVAILAAGLMFSWLSRLLPRAARQRIARLFRHIYFDLFNGAWRLALLGSAAIALSVASLWTTWGGLGSFTRHPVLAFLIGLGIQAVMLMSAWLIGESFADGLSGRSTAPGAGQRAVENWAGVALGVVLAGAALWWVLDGISAEPWQPLDALWRRVLVVAEILVAGLLVIGIAYCFRANALVRPYVQGLGVMVKSTVLWVMFLASLAASVFFSFDYHFNSIFTAKLRTEAADSRAREQVPNILNDLGPLIKDRLEKEQGELFSTPAWTSYDRQLKIAREIGNRIPDSLEQQNNEEIQRRQARIAELELKLATLNAPIKPLETRIKTLQEKVDSNQAKRPGLQTAVNEIAERIGNLEKSVHEAEGEVANEAGGVPGRERSGIVGRGQKYQAAVRELNRRKTELKTAQDTELSPAQKLLTDLDNDIKNGQNELGTLNSKLAELTGGTKQTEQALQIERTAQKNAESVVDPRTAGYALARQIQDFRQAPSVQGLKEIQSSCNVLKNVAMKVKDGEGSQVDCDPERVNEALKRFLDRKSTADAFIDRCANSQRIRGLEPRELVTEARGCLQDAQLGIDVLAPLRTKLRELETMRDDEAQSFIVTLNAFKERHWLAYLALAIALGVDGLIFFAGVFGATTMLSPLERTGLRDVARRVRRIPIADVRAALDSMRDNRFYGSQLDDPRINRLVAVGFGRQIPGEPAGSHLVMRDENDRVVTYRLHRLYLDELLDLAQKAEQRGEFDEAPDEAARLAAKSPRAPSADGEYNRIVRLVVAPRRSAGRA